MRCVAYNVWHMSDNPFRNLPSVDRLLSYTLVADLSISRDMKVSLCREAIAFARDVAKDGTEFALEDIVARIKAKADMLMHAGPIRVINATGVILHTNLGRAPLSSDSLSAVQQSSAGYTDLEMNLEDGQRGSRYSHAENLLKQITGAEAAIVVNNNASAVLLALAAVARDKEVIVSRGESVEIGGGFRIPDVMRASGAVLNEIGTTNRTYVSDYEDAINENAAALLKVHTSNFIQAGFTNSVNVEELALLARSRNIILLNDIGSGCLVDTTKYGLVSEPTVQESVEAGVSLTLFSGDKLLGGPQAGIGVGSKEVIDRLKMNPISRAVRIDKMDLAALVATLRHYLNEEIETKIPVWQMISSTKDVLKLRVEKWLEAAPTAAEIIESESTIGGGSLPGQTLPTYVLAIPKSHAEGGLDRLANRMRQASPPVVGRIDDGRFLLDPRSVLLEEDNDVINALSYI
jgi:L-seryl-tRNA(Ser) seleniumtransferase